MASTLKDEKVLVVGRGMSVESVDLTDDDSIAGLARRVGAV
jgi:hypothetical protein